MFEDIRLRPTLDSDRPFLYDLHVATMRGMIEQLWGWDEAWQREDFERRVQRCRVSIIELADVPVGAVWTESRPESLHISELQVVPAAQGRGIGTTVLREVMGEAARIRMAVTLSVFPINRRAMHLYERLGFRVIAAEDHFIHMRYE